MVTAPNNQIVGQSLRLKCNGTLVRGITSQVDIIWKTDDLELDRTNGTKLTLTEGTSLAYMSTYTIIQLSTFDEDRMYYCELVINSPSPVVVNDSITLNVTSKL